MKKLSWYLGALIDLPFCIWCMLFHRQHHQQDPTRLHYVTCQVWQCRKCEYTWLKFPK